MGLKTKEVFKWGAYRIVWADSDDIEGSLRFLKEHHLDGIGVSPHLGYQAKDLTFLKEARDIKGLVIAYGEEIDIASVSQCENLNFLSVSGNKQPLSLETMSCLHDLSLDWHGNIKFPEPEKAVSINRLSLRGYKGSDLNGLPLLKALKVLALVQPALVTLNGIERFQQIDSVELSYCSKLVSVSAVTALSSLSTLHMEVCRKVADYPKLVECHGLKSLWLNDCGHIETIRFIRNIPKLEEFRFAKTVVDDGDLAPCIGLKRVGFLPKKHYSHKPDQFNG